jgi:hypothetical protein
MFSRETARFTALAACLLVAAGGLAVLADANGRAPAPRPPQIDPFDMMSKAQGLREEKIENLY